MTEAVHINVKNEMAVIRIDSPPVNAASHAVRAGLVEKIEAFEANSEAAVAIIVCAGRTFVAGADIREFGKPPQTPILPDVVKRVEQCSKPVVAVLHGTALGGGLELALGAHYRVALPGARMGLPEVTLGLLPGAGGTQRLPRLAGIDATLKMTTTGEIVGAERALALGIIDTISAQADPETAGIEFAREILEKGEEPRPISSMARPQIDTEAAAEWRAKLEKSARGQIAPLRCVDAVLASASMEFDAGLALEREIFVELMNSPQREGLIHAFFSEREVAKLPEIKGIEPREVRSVGVVGGGTMGCGIAVSALLKNLHVTLIERDDESVARAKAAVEGILSGSVKRGKLSGEQKDAILSDRFVAATNYSTLSKADLVVEAVFESMEVKQAVFEQLDEHCRPGAILASNTSYLDVNQIAQFTKRPEDVIGLHFFSPAHIMKLLEVVVADKTAADVVATGFALAKTLKKIPVRAGVCDGFIGNRILNTYRTHADHMVLDGADPYQIDRVLVANGFAMGPFAVSDLAGLDIGWATRKRLAPIRDPRERIATFADAMCGKGWFGAKSGQGFYLHGKDQPRGTPNPEVGALIDADRAARGITPRRFSDEEIFNRYMAAMINEAAKVVGEGIALRPLDVDVVLLNGYGFPRHMGGPLKYADRVGVKTILERVETYAQDDAFFWSPAPLLQKLVAKDRNFEALNSLEKA